MVYLRKLHINSFAINKDSFAIICSFHNFIGSPTPEFQARCLGARTICVGGEVGGWAGAVACTAM